MNKIARMIVTYNRRELLDRCLNALEEQTCQGFDILVVDNGSHDDTGEYLLKRKESCNAKAAYERFIIVTVAENEGMANGYNVGYEAVFSRGYDWIWTMDDDGLPEKHQLEELMKAAKQTGLYYLNSLVCNINNPEQLAFGLAGIKSTAAAMEHPFIYGSVNPDNGTFIHKKVFEKCGNIMKELVSYGMETEYVTRVKRDGFEVVTVTTSIHYHPLAKVESRNVIPWIKSVIITDYSYEKMWLIRNKAYINHRYIGVKGELKMWTTYFIYYLLRLHFKKMRLFCQYYIEGCKGIVGDKKEG